LIREKRIKTGVILLLDHLEFWNIVIIGIGIHDRIYQGLFIFHDASEAEIIPKKGFIDRLDFSPHILKIRHFNI